MRTGQKISLAAGIVAELLRCRRPVGKAGSVMVIRTDRLGDFALFLPFAAALRRAFPRGERRLILLGRDLWLPLAETLLDFDAYLSIDPGRFLTDRGYRRELLTALRADSPELLLQTRYFREVLVEDYLALASRPNHSVAFRATRRHPGHRLLRMFDSIYTTLLPGEPTNEHELLRHHRFLAAVADGVKITNPFSPCPLPPPAPWRRGEYAVVLPGSGKGELCRWPPERFAALGREIPLPCAVAGTAGEAPELLATAAGIPGATALPGTLSVVEFAALIGNARLVIGNDTGGIHLAALFGVPSLAIVGCGQPGWFLPYPDQARGFGFLPPVMVSAACSYAGCDWQCRFPERPVRCVEAVTTEAAQVALRKLL